MIAIWILLIATLLNINTSIVGSFLVIRKMSMISDAISHAVLPGIVIAYLFSGSQESILTLIGAIFFGLITTFLIQLLSKFRNIEQGAAIGTIYTFLFASGIILISYYTRQVDLDLDCVLYGEIAYTPLDIYIVNGKNIGPKAIYTLLGSSFLLIILVGLFYKELIATSFDQDYSQAIGINTTFIHYLLMSLVSIITVISFELVGAILVVAFLVGPVATAYLWTQNVKKMILFSNLFGILSILLGYFTAYSFNASIAGSIAVYIGVVFILSIIIKNWKLKLKQVNS